MIDTLPHIIHDTLYVRNADAMELLTKTNDFYTHAWDKLALLFTSLFAVIGILIPIGSSIFLSRQVRIQRKGLQEEITTELSKIQREFFDDVDKRFSAQLQTVDNRFKGSSKAIEGTFHANDNRFDEAFVSWLQGLYYFSLSGDTQNFRTIIDNMTRIIRTINLDNTDRLVRALTPTAAGFDMAIESITGRVQNHEIIEQLQNLLRQYENRRNG